MKLISEKLKLNNDSTVTSKCIRELKPGDKIYVLNLIGLNDEDVPLIHTYKIEDGFTRYEEAKFLKGYYGFSYVDEYKELRVKIFKSEMIDKDPSMRTFEDHGQIFCSDKSLIEKIIDDNIDEKIKPLQEEIDTCQKKINKLLKQKENKYKI